MIWELDVLKLKIVTLYLYRQVICHREAKILCFSNIYKLFRFVQYSSKYHELNMVKHLKTMNALWFLCLFMPVARNLVQIKNISILRLCMHYLKLCCINYKLRLDNKWKTDPLNMNSKNMLLVLKINTTLELRSRVALIFRTRNIFFSFILNGLFSYYSWVCHQFCLLDKFYAKP